MEKWTLPNKERLQEIQASFLAYLRHPIREISHLPNLTWIEFLILHGVLTAATGALSGLMSKSLLGIISGMILSPFLTLITLGISAYLFRLIFQMLGHSTQPFRKLMTLALFANVPFFVLQVIAGLFPVISLIGLGITALLSIKGLSTNFQIPREMCTRVVAGLALVFFMMWTWSKWDSLKIGSDIHEAPEVYLGR